MLVIVSVAVSSSFENYLLDLAWKEEDESCTIVAEEDDMKSESESVILCEIKCITTNFLSCTFWSGNAFEESMRRICVP